MDQGTQYLGECQPVGGADTHFLSPVQDGHALLRHLKLCHGVYAVPVDGHILDEPVIMSPALPASCTADGQT